MVIRSLNFQIPSAFDTIVAVAASLNKGKTDLSF